MTLKAKIIAAIALSAMLPALAYSQSYYVVMPVTGLVAQAPTYGSCKALLEAGKSTGDGTYTIEPASASTPFDVYCDMTTDGGGWTEITQALAQDKLGITLNALAGFAIWDNNRIFMGDTVASGKLDGTINITVPFGYQEFYLQDYYWADYNDPNNTNTFDVNKNGIVQPYSEIQSDSDYAGDITIGTDDNATATMGFYVEMGSTSLEGGVFQVPVNKKIFDNGLSSQSLVIRALDAGPEDEDVFPWYQGSIFVR